MLLIEIRDATSRGRLWATIPVEPAEDGMYLSRYGSLFTRDRTLKTAGASRISIESISSLITIPSCLNLDRRETLLSLTRVTFSRHCEANFSSGTHPRWSQVPTLSVPRDSFEPRYTPLRRVAN